MLRFIHLTDCHLLNTPDETLRAINTYDTLSAVVNDVRQMESQIDFVLVTGDISQSGDVPSYQLFKHNMDQLNIPIYCLPGNHDNTSTLKSMFQTSPDAAISVNLIKNHLLILLNSAVINAVSGTVSDNQIQQLKNTLASNRSRPVIIGLHHPPITINSIWMDNIGLTNTKELMTLLEEFNMVKLVLFGHAHQEVNATHKHMHLVATPSTCFQFKPITHVMEIDHAPPSYRVVEFINGSDISTQVHYVSGIE